MRAYTVSLLVGKAMMSTYIHEQTEIQPQPGRTGRVLVRLDCPLAGVGLVAPVFSIRGFAQLNGIEAGMT